MPFVIIIAIGAAVAFVGMRRRKDRAGRARWLKREGGVLMGIYSAFLLLFVAGEGVTDPGGLRAAVWIGLWAAIIDPAKLQVGDIIDRTLIDGWLAHPIHIAHLQTGLECGCASWRSGYIHLRPYLALPVANDIPNKRSTHERLYGVI